MQLPGRLRSTTLGDLLGILCRGSATGTLELAEDRGRVHRVCLARGLVLAVEIEGASPSLAEILRGERAADEDLLRRSLLRALASSRLHGEVLIEDFQLSPRVVGDALRSQLLTRLAVLERLADARISFRVAVRPPRSALVLEAVRDEGGRAWNGPLQPREFLLGRRRAKVRAPAPSSPESRAWEVLGLSPGTELPEIKRAYRRLARAIHPDLHPAASAEQRRTLETRFAELTDAYRALVA